MRIFLTILVLLCVGRLAAQQNTRAISKALTTSVSGTGKSYYSNTNEPPRAIEFKSKTVTASQFISNINTHLALPVEFTFAEVESNSDRLGMQHHLLQQYYKGIPVEGMMYRVHEKDGFATSANGKAVRKITLDPQVILTEEQAFQLASKHLHTNDSVAVHGKKLIVSKDFTFTPESFSIAYQFDIDVSLIEQWRISIDARNGELLNKVPLVNNCFSDPDKPLPYGTGTGLTNYYGTQNIKVETFSNGSSRLRGLTANGGIIETYDFRNVNILSLVLFFEWHSAYDFYSANNTYNTNYTKPAVSAQWAAEQAYEYYFTKHNRNSFDNKGSVIKSYVHVDQNLNNAFWTRNLLAFGDGSNNNPMVELDVVSHELTHGVNQYEANLQYYNEPGALNESFSDILGKAVEFHTFGDTATWQVARHWREGGLRDMSNPNFKNQPDTYMGDMWYTGYEDNGGVHYNSGVQNFWFYLLCEGGSGVNDHDYSYSINPIGIETATNIVYRNLTEYVSPFSDYLDCRLGSMLATTDLYGKNSTVYQEVDKAWDAVGVIDEPIITGLEVYDITATTVKLKGSLAPRGDTVTYVFEYGTTPALGSSSKVYKYSGKVEGILTGLESETKYYLRLVATNENGSTVLNSEFTTISLAPLARIKQTVDVTETTARLYGEINPNSLNTSFYFEYGLTEALGLVTPTYALSDTTEFLSASAVVTNLLPRQNYYYRLVATNNFASATTESVNFFTATKPVISSFSPSTAPVGAEITIAGENFNMTPEKNWVSFGATRATVLSSTATEIKVKVPAGASFAPVTLLDAESGLIAESVADFVPTYTGEFTTKSLIQTVGTNDNIWQVLVHDMDGDYKPDLVARHYLGFSVFLNVNQGGDVSDASFVRNTFNGEYSPGVISLVDFDGNGLQDIVGRWQNGLRIYPNYSVQGFMFFGTPVDLPATSALQNVVFNDFDKDGHVDIGGTLSYSFDSTAFAVFRNENPKGTLSSDYFTTQFLTYCPFNPYFLTTTDLNNDGGADVLIGQYDKRMVKILKNVSHAGVIKFEIDSVPDGTNGRFARYSATDLNGDGWRDIIGQSPYENGALALFENQRSASDISVSTPVVNLTGYAHPSVEPGDINGDGRVDLVVGTDIRKFLILKNNVPAGEHLSSSSFDKFQEYGMPLPDRESGADARITINDLNGDGRPEIISVISYSYGPHDGYGMEIWQNGPVTCIDASDVKVSVVQNTATILLPANRTLDEYEIQYAFKNSNSWMTVGSTTLQLYTGYAYQLRARAKCYLGFTDYFYKEFMADCVDSNSFGITNIGTTSVSLSAYNLSSFEVQYSLAGKNQWTSVPQNAAQILSLVPSSLYDIRFRGRCSTLGEFNYKQFTTLCPQLTGIAVSELQYDRALVNVTTNYSNNVILEYSADNINWTLLDETRRIFGLKPTKNYFIRGKQTCTNNSSTYIYVSFTTPCPKISTLSVNTITPFSARINWVDESKTGSYILTYSSAAGNVFTVQTNKTSYDLTSLTAGTQYSVAVAPQCTMTKDFTATTFNTVCYAPFNLTVDALTQTTAQLSWNADFDALPYAIEYTISGSGVWLTNNAPLPQGLLSELRPGTQYEARVHINCPSETAPYASVHFETELYGSVTYAPNPTASLVTIYPSRNLIGNRFSILDNAGKELGNGLLMDYTIDLSVFPPGMYTLKIEGEKPVRLVRN